MYEKFEKLRTAKGVSVRAVAIATKTPPSCLYDWRAGRTKSLTPEKLKKIADYFGVTLDYFVE